MNVLQLEQRKPFKIRVPFFNHETSEYIIIPVINWNGVRAHDFEEKVNPLDPWNLGNMPLDTPLYRLDRIRQLASRHIDSAEIDVTRRVFQPSTTLSEAIGEVSLSEYDSIPGFNLVGIGLEEFNQYSVNVPSKPITVYRGARTNGEILYENLIEHGEEKIRLDDITLGLHLRHEPIYTRK